MCVPRQNRFPETDDSSPISRRPQRRQLNSFLPPRALSLVLPPVPLAAQPNMDTDGAGAPGPQDTRNVQVDNAIRAIQQKKPLPEIDFSIHQMEDGSQVSTMERVCKGMSTPYPFPPPSRHPASHAQPALRGLANWAQLRARDMANSAPLLQTSKPLPCSSPPMSNSSRMRRNKSQISTS